MSEYIRELIYQDNMNNKNISLENQINDNDKRILASILRGVFR